MISKSNHKPSTIWLRDIYDNGTQKITLRRSFSEETIINGEVEEVQHSYEETDVIMLQRDNMEGFINNNLNELFELGLQQEEENNIEKQNKLATMELINNNKLPDELRFMGQTITGIMLEVM